MTTPDSPELLTVDQFAKRLQLSRASVFAWVNRGILIQGKHFFKYGKVVRFVYSANTLELLLSACVIEESPSSAKNLSRAARQTKPSPVNWEY